MLLLLQSVTRRILHSKRVKLIVFVIIAAQVGYQLSYNNGVGIVGSTMLTNPNNDNVVYQQTAVSVQDGSTATYNTTAMSDVVVSTTIKSSSSESMSSSTLQTVAAAVVLADDDDFHNTSHSKMQEQQEQDANEEEDLVYPFISKSILSYCGIESPPSSFQQQHLLNVSFGYIKPHKTGSTTIGGIINRLLYHRPPQNLIKMIPNDFTYLGWPHTFPTGDGHKDYIFNLEQGGIVNKYDAICNHAKYSSREEFQKYFKNPLYLFTILRQPVNRTISSFNFFPHPNIKGGWEQFTYKYQPQHFTKIKSWKHAVDLNNQAFTLGWYTMYNNSTINDYNKTLIQEFIKRIDFEFDIVMILEDLSMSLTLLADSIPQLDITELVWYDYFNKPAGTGGGDEEDKSPQSQSDPPKVKLYPTLEQEYRLQRMLYLDQMIYNHFRLKLHKLWERRIQENPSLIKQKQSLECLHSVIMFNINNNNNEGVRPMSSSSTTTSTTKPTFKIPTKLKKYFETSSYTYTKLLKKRQIKLQKQPLRQQQ